jgi:hypothetical protein
MSEVELQAIYSGFNEAKAEYIELLSEINTTCLGDTVSDTCTKAAELNILMQDYLIQMSNLFKSTDLSENQTQQDKIVEISKKLQEENHDLKVLETNKALEKDSQVIATMNYNQALLWFVVCITIVLLLYNQSLILFFACITIVVLLYHKLWFLACITAGLLYCFLAN